MIRARVETRLGALRGARDGAVHCFRGIPYAAPPIDERRFRAPAPPEPWDGLRDAGGFPAAPPQTRPTPTPQSESCLELCIWTPAVDGAPRPVLVWLHGADYLHGSLAQPVYNPARLARRGDAVVVTVQSRLGALGFLDLPGREANRGLLDQLAALRFVRDEIDAFGGDPSRVTVFGTGAGAGSALALVAAGAAPALFSRTIAQRADLEVLPKSTAREVRASFFEALDLTAETALAKLQSLPIETLLRAQAATQARWRERGLNPFRPCVDGQLLQRAPGEQLADLEELTLVLELPPAGPRSVPGLTALLGRARDGVYAYRFESPLSAPEADPGRVDPAPGSADPVANALEEPDVPFVMGTLEALPGEAALDRDARRLARHMQDAWLAFARSGNPSHRGIGAWPRYDPRRPTTLHFGRTIRLV